MPVFIRPRHLSAKGADFLAAWEGEVLHPYNDSGGNATIGVGHLLHLGPVTEEDRQRWAHFTKAHSRLLLRQDAERAATCLRMRIVPKLNQAQFDALVSFTFNVGCGNLASSTLLQKLNKHPGTWRGVVGPEALHEVRSELLRWDRDAHGVEPGLRKRRLAEGRLFAVKDYSGRP